MNDLVSFIFVNRDGKDLDKAIQNVNDVYSDLNKEIIVIEQDDNKPFMRGQLFNIGVKYANGKYIALSDNDMYHLRKVPWIDIYEEVKKPLIGFKYISQITFRNNIPYITSTKDTPTGFGGFNFMTKEDFISFNGFSNLYLGWGYEDNAYSKRFECIRIPQNLGHITHPINRRFDFSKNREYNKQLSLTESNRNKFEDGYKQTIYNENDKKIINNVLYVKVSNIYVCENFKYIDILNKHYSYIK